MMDLELLKESIRCKPVSENVPCVNRAVECMHEFLRVHGLHCEIQELNGRKILYAATSPGRIQDVLLNAHLDVVPAPDSMFEPEERDGKLFGRGTADCLGHAVIIARLLCDCAGKPGISAIFTSDEEIGGETTAFMVKQGYGARKMILVLDGAPGAIACAQKGILVLTLRASGKGGHASIPWCLDNPIDRLIDGYRNLRSAWPALPDDHWGDSMAPCILSAGSAGNQIPDTAEMVLNIRFVREENRGEILRRVRELTGLEVTVDQETSPLFVDENHPAMQLLRKTMQEQYPGREIPFFRMHGATDARHFARSGVPIAILGTDAGGVHMAEEWISIQGMEDTLRILKNFIGKL